MSKTTISRNNGTTDNEIFIDIGEMDVGITFFKTAKGQEGRGGRMIRTDTVYARKEGICSHNLAINVSEN